MIDWSELTPYQNHKYRSFEKLCYHIAKALHEEKGRFTSVDDIGGGDGVEFYLTLENGDQWGWQAKFYHPEPRLSKSGRKRSIKDSLEKACEIHPHLKKWILCTPTDFTTKEQSWFKDTLCQSIPENMDIQLEHWGESDFNHWLSEPRFRGQLLYFFDKLELDLEWFKKQMAGVGEKFDSSLHTETNVDAEIHALLGDKAFVRQITKWIEKLEEELSDLKEAINKLNSPIPYIEWSEEEKSKVIDAAKSLQEALVNMKVQLKQVRDLLGEKALSEVQSIDWKSALDQLYETFDAYRKVGRESGTSKMECTVEKEYEEQALHHARGVVHDPDSLVANLLDKFFPSVIWQLGLINESDLHILGDAGIGKTHIACNICDDRLKNGLPALFVRGSQFRNDQAVKVQLRELLDIPPFYSWYDFLQALSAAAEAYHTRIPLIIDGLNESVHNGTFSNIWESGLKGLVQEIAQTKNLVLITTCRKSYEEVIWKEVSAREDIIPGKIIWKDKDSLNLFYARGFDTDEVTQEAIDKYFNAYKIKTDLTLAPLMQFEHPLHLKIFCETKNRERKTEIEVYGGEQTLFEVFEAYLEQLDTSLCKHFGHHQATHIVDSALSKIATYLWERRSRHIPLKELVPMIDDRPFEKVVWSSSKTRAIVDEGLLLIYRDWVEGTEVVSFTHDLLGGYLIARHLVQQAAKHGRGYLHRTVSNLFGKHNSPPFLKDIKKCLRTPFLTKIRRFWHNLWGHKTEHPLCDDIGRCLAALLRSTDQFLHEFSDNKKAFSLSIRALFEISPKYINEECTGLIACLFELPQCRKPLLELAETTVGHPGHPFNASFWSNQLLALSMAERDLSWSEYIRLDRESFEKRLNGFEETCQSDQELSDIDKERLHLLAEYIMWILTSTVRPLRDQGTRALYWYGRRFPQEFFDLVIKSFSIKDPYVPERMLAAAYGIAMALQNDFEDTNFVTQILPLYARQLYENMFTLNAPHATTHILTRDYARRTIDVALIHHPDLLTADERARITPPFTDGGIREWDESEDRNKGEREKGPAPLQMDFENYTLGSLVKDRGNYNYEHPEYKRVRANILWRIYALGYSSDGFGEIDALLNQQNQVYGRSANGGKTDRYGKKYSWIAFYELAGFRQDNDLLPDYDTNLHILDIDIDPSFPDEQYRYNLVKEDFLGDRNVSHQEWVFKSNHPDLTNYLKIDRFCEDLKMDRLCGEDGPWVLLWGSMSQEDKKNNRDIFTLIQGLIVKPEETEAIVETFTNQEARDRSNMPFCPKDYYIYAGEVPWCDTYSENSCEEIQIEIGTEYKTFEVLVPVRENNWEDHRSAINSNRSVAIPSRQIAEALGLCGQPQSFDLFEKENGKRASITFRYGEGWGEMQRFTYLRQDLLERYLAETGNELIWIIWGERRQVSQNPDAPYKYFHEVKVYRDIQKAGGDS